MSDIPPIVKSLSDISMIMGDGVKFLKLRFQCEQWAKEAEEGNEDSATLITLIGQFEKLIKVITK